MVTQEAGSRNPTRLPEGPKYLNSYLFGSMKVFSEDSVPLDVRPNTILSHPLVGYCEDDWVAWMN